MADSYSQFTGDSYPSDDKESGAVKSGKVAVRGLAEAVPVYGEKLASDLPMPTTFTERLTRRAARNAPYALAAAPFTGGVPAAIGYLGSVGAGTVAEELGAPEWAQTTAELAGGLTADAGRKVAGKVLGFVEPQLTELASKAGQIFEIGPGAKTSVGMKYGAGETEEAAIRNLNKFTKEATRRAGFPTDKVDSAWIGSAQKSLGKEVDDLFKGKTFDVSADPNFTTTINQLDSKAKGVYGKQSNVVKNILKNNIKGERPKGSFMSNEFSAKDLRSAIEDINLRLRSADGPQAKILGDLKDALDKLAYQNLAKTDIDAANAYLKWKEKYHSFATIRDVIQRAGEGGVTKAGQINPKTLKDLLDVRTGGNATRNPLFYNLGEFGDILKYQPQKAKGFTQAGLDVLSESPFSKTLTKILQPKAMSKRGEIAKTAQTLSPLQRATQQTGGSNSKDPYSQFTNE